MKRILFFLILIYSPTLQGQTTIDTIFRNSYKVFELQRLPNGMYRDAKLFSGADYHPISISNTGMGLISLCIADAMNWIDNAQELALATLKTVNGHHPTFNPDRTANGYFRHFMDINTGAQMWNSEYSTIDTDILMSAALFAKEYFQNDSISHYATTLWSSIEFEAAINDPANGSIFLSMNADGSGIPNSLTLPYSEYMIVAWISKNASDDPNSKSQQLWNNFYNSPVQLPKINYNNFEVLTDNSTSFLSSFTHQFNYYLCHHFTSTAEYLDYFENAQNADFSWWSNFHEQDYEWGLGAGSAISNPYQANAINNNVDTIISPHIIAGFLPVNLSGEEDLVNLWNDHKGKYTLPSGDPILWRYSKNDNNWLPNEIIGIDHSTLLFGLATLPQNLGENFFPTYNNFSFDLPTNTTEVKKELQYYSLYPNPSTQLIKISGVMHPANYTIYTTSGKEVLKGQLNANGEINIQGLNTDLYFLVFEDGAVLRFIKH